MSQDTLKERIIKQLEQDRKADKDKVYVPPAGEEADEILALLDEEPDLSHLDVEHPRELWRLADHMDKDHRHSALLLKTDDGYSDLVYQVLIPKGEVMTTHYMEEAMKSGIMLPPNVSYNQITQLHVEARNSDAKKK